MRASKHLREMFDGEAMALQEGVHGAIRSTANGVQKSFVDVPRLWIDI